MDGGWGWVIVVASFIAQLLAYGSPQSVGVLYPEWLDAFQESKGMTAWVGSLVSGVGLIASKLDRVIHSNVTAVKVYPGHSTDRSVGRSVGHKKAKTAGKVCIFPQTTL